MKTSTNTEKVKNFLKAGENWKVGFWIPCSILGEFASFPKDWDIYFTILEDFSLPPIRLGYFFQYVGKSNTPSHKIGNWLLGYSHDMDIFRFLCVSIWHYFDVTDVPIANLRTCYNWFVLLDISHCIWHLKLCLRFDFREIHVHKRNQH